jgi:organic hydroperoxide reductase OsmC/OhrA
MTDQHHYDVTVTWTGNTGTGTSDYRAYSRSFDLDADGKHTIAGSSDPVFRGDADRWNPEELFLGSLSACHKLWYVHLASVSGIVVSSYSDHAEGIMRTEPGSDGGRFVSVTLHPIVTLESGEPSLAQALHAEAHKRCFIANSVNFPIVIESAITTAAGATAELVRHGS